MTTGEFVQLIHAKPAGRGQWMARCPAHTDKNPSLSVGTGNDGKILLTCHAGCTREAILTALGLTSKELFPEQPVVREFAYRNREGATVFIVCRIDATATEPKKIWQRGAQGEKGLPETLKRDGSRPLYGLPNLLQHSTPVLVVEGESHADRLIRDGILATTTSQGAGKARFTDLTPLVGCTVILCPDNDGPGRSHMFEIGQRLLALGQTPGAIHWLDLRDSMPDLKEKADVLDWLAAGHEIGELKDLIGNAAVFDAKSISVTESGNSVPFLSPNEEDAKPLPRNDSSINVNSGTFVLEPWEEPIPLQSDTPRPSFPTESLPAWLRAWVEAESVATQTPPDLAGCLALGVLSACLANAVIVSPKGGWMESTALYVVVGMGSGERKSPVFRDATSAIEALEHDDSEAMRLPLVQALAERDVLEKQLAELKGKVARGKGDMQDVHDVAGDLEALNIPEIPRYLAEDITIEQLATMMSGQESHRLAIMSAEGAFFDNISGRYSDHPTFDLLLKAYTSEPFRVDRVGRAPDIIDRPALSLVLAVQPSVIHDLAQFAPFTNRGLLARILYSLPLSWVGSRAVDTPPVPTQVRNIYDQRVSDLFKWGIERANNHDSVTLTLSLGAYDELLSFLRDLEPRLGPGGDLSHYAGWGNKLGGTVLRLAAILHYAKLPYDYDSQTTLDVNTIQSAISLARYFTQHAQAAFGLMALDPEIQGALAILNYLKSHEDLARKSTDGSEIEVSERDLYRAMKSQFRHARDIKSPLALLIEHGYLQRKSLGNQPSKGRPPSPIYYVHPLWLKDRNATNDKKPENPMNMRVSGDLKMVTEMGQKSPNQGQKSFHLQESLKEVVTDARF